MFNRILVTHAHADHFGGVYDSIRLLEENKRCTEDLRVYKWLTDNDNEQEVFERYPSLRERVSDIANNQVFEVEDGLTIEALHTPGHLDDHTSFLIREVKTLICGDVILGSTSTAIQDLDTYFTTLGLI